MFKPKRILFEKNTKDTEIGERVYNRFKDDVDIEIVDAIGNRVKQYIPGEELPKFYTEGKKTLVVGKRKKTKFQTCKPSAHYQLPLVSGCMGQCEYCYLNTRLGDKPFIKVHVNVEEILEQADEYAKERLPEVTIFEGAATSDPVPTEPYTHALARAIEFFGEREYTRFRFVTKYNDVDTLKDIKHNNHTEVRFSINTDYVISSYENATASYKQRIIASMKMIEAGYSVGFLVAPVFIYPNWKKEYEELLRLLKDSLPEQVKHPITFEVIAHRYTTAAKNKIIEIFPGTTVPMNDEERQYKYGQFGYGKFVYPKDSMQEIKEFFTKVIGELFGEESVKYII